MKKYLYIPIVILIMAALGACDSSSSSTTRPPETTTNQPNQAGSNEPGPSDPLPADPTTPVSTTPSLLGLQEGLSLTRAQFLQNLGSGIATSTEEFRRAADALNQAALAYCSSYDPALLEQAKLRFAEAMMVWQRLEFFQVGPLVANASTLKYKIYGWPQLSNYCKIDEESLLALSDPDYSLPSNTNRKGLQALEYLIFDGSLTSICPASNETKANWEALTPAKKWEARCAYMKPVAAELLANAVVLETQWGAADDNIASRAVGNQLAEQSVLQELFNNLFYLDLEIKNQKLAAPAGQDVKYCNKTPAPCLDKEELHYSHLSKQALAANFRALADIIFGFGEPRKGGLSALIRGENADAVASKSEKDVAGLVKLSETQTASFETVITSKAAEDCEISQSSWVCKLRQAIKDIASDFKNEYSSVLKTSVPVAPQGDND